MMATTVFLWMRVPSVTERYKTALIISGLVTFIAAYHYIRIFNSWVDAYQYPSDSDMTHFMEHEHITSLQHDGRVFHLDGMHGFKAPYHIHHHAIPGQTAAPTITGTPFNDAYRYMDWLLTVPLLLMEIVLVMNLPKEESNSKCWVLGLASATNSEPDPVVKGLLQNVQLTTVISWCTYPIVYLFPMLHIGGAHAVLAIQIGYCVSDIISKCGVGLMIYQITITKSNNERAKM